MTEAEAIELDDWYSNTAATFGDRLAAARELAGLSQEELAGQLGVKLKSLRDWENDVNDPRANRLQMLSGILNVSISWLLTGTGEGLGAETPDLSDRARLTEIVSEIQALQAEMGSLSNRLRKLEKNLLSTIAS